MSSFLLLKYISCRSFSTLPKKKMPVKTIIIFCNSCKTKLYTYRKGGKGALVKCIEERIVKDFTNKDYKCPNCLKEFGRPFRLGKRNAIKFIGDRVYHRK